MTESLRVEWVNTLGTSGLRLMAVRNGSVASDAIASVSGVFSCRDLAAAILAALSDDDARAVLAEAAGRLGCEVVWREVAGR